MKCKHFHKYFGRPVNQFWSQFLPSESKIFFVKYLHSPSWRQHILLEILALSLLNAKYFLDMPVLPPEDINFEVFPFGPCWRQNILYEIFYFCLWKAKYSFLKYPRSPPTARTADCLCNFKGRWQLRQRRPGRPGPRWSWWWWWSKWAGWWQSPN